MVDLSSTEARAAVLRKAGIAAAQAGQKARARRYLRQSVALDGDAEETWLWLAGVAPTAAESEFCLRQALALNPRSERARAGLQWLAQRSDRDSEIAGAGAASQEEIGPPKSRPRLRYWVGAVLVVWLIVLGVGGFLLSTVGAGSPIAVLPRPTPTETPVPATPTPTVLEHLQTLHDPLWAAWEAKNWPECLHVLEQMASLQRDYAGLDDWFVAVHSAWATELLEAGDLEGAIAHFDAVIELDPGHELAQTQRLLARSYLDAQASAAAAEWDAAISHLRAALDLDPSYRDAEALLYLAYLNRGVQQQQAGDLQAAKSSYEEALAVQDGSEAREALAEVVFLLTPPTPTPMPKRIEVYIGQQRMYVYEGDRLIWNWVVSTGEPGRDTRTGHFQVLDKIPNAYASRWDLQMPHWLGIYYAGASENGIHALPILSNGQRLWAGFLGQRVSYGCVILGVEEARLLYEWAEVGTPVDIYP